MTATATPSRPQAQSKFQKARSISRAARRLASRSAAITVWWNRQPAPRPDFLTPMTLTLSLGYPIRRMAAALRWLGWRQIIRRVRGKQVVLWLPPSTTIKPRPRGRPRIHQS